MQIEKIDIKDYFYYSGDASQTIDGVIHIKQLKSLSVVQSKIGSYGIKLGTMTEQNTDEGGIFIAPPFVTQKITHHANIELNKFRMRFLFLDAIINERYRMDDVFDFPVIANAAATREIDRNFDCMDNTVELCDRMSCIYQIIKHLIYVSNVKEKVENQEIFLLKKYIEKNYMNRVTVQDMSKFIKMSESNLYAVFKKTFGVSPIKYLNNYRLSVASEYLLRSNESIQRVAEAVGIPDSLYFSKIFKRKYLCSPQQYRAKTQIKGQSLILCKPQNLLQNDNII